MTTKSKQIPFNAQMPWGESIASQLGSSLDELKRNLPKDPQMASIVAGTCGMVRDMAVKTLIEKNSKAAVSITDICQGVGQVMHEGNMVPTGGCMSKAVNTKSEAEDQTTMNPGDGSNTISKTCELREGDTFIRLRRFFGNLMNKPMTPKERLINQNMIGQHNTTGLGAINYKPPGPPGGGEAAFIQLKTKGDKSQDEIPDYFAPHLNGKGFTHNTEPVKRHDTNANKATFNNLAQATRPTPEGEGAAEESEALGSMGVKVPVTNSDANKEVIKMVIPDQVCTALCAGLDLSGILGGAMVEPPEAAKPPGEEQLGNTFMDTEEGTHLNTKRQGMDWSLNGTTGATSDENPLESGKDYSGGYVCSAASPKPMDCLEKGTELAHWVTQRIINVEHFCDQESGNCDSIVGEA